MKPQMLDEPKTNIRIKLAALWTAVTFFYIYGDYFELYIPGKTAGLISGENLLNTPVKLVAASILLAIPPLLIILSVMAPPKLARALNIVFGIFFTAVMLLIGAMSLSVERAAYVLYALIESMITIVIIWQAWNWPKNISQQ